jgi:hypothetical protein
MVLLAGLTVALFAGLVWEAIGQKVPRAQESCRAPQPVCGAVAAVFRISAHDPFASAVRISANELVTAKRVVLDRERVNIHLPGGATIEGEVVPSAFGGDLALIRAQLPEGPALSVSGKDDGVLYVVALDQASRAIAPTPAGEAIMPPHASAPSANLHHTAPAQRGSSGGALVDELGGLVAIQTMAGRQRSEAVPARHIAALTKASGAEQKDASRRRGEAYGTCMAISAKARRVSDVLPENIARDLIAACLAAGARDLIEGAGQILSKSRMQEKASALFARALEIDPNAVDAHMGRTIVLGIQRRHREALVNVRWMLEAVPWDRDVQRVALQASKAAGDRALIERTLALIAEHNPTGLEAAKGFVGITNAPLPRL